MSADDTTEDTEKSSPHDHRGEEHTDGSAESSSGKHAGGGSRETPDTEASPGPLDADSAEEADDPIVSGSSEAEFDEAMRRAEEAQQKARDELDPVDLGDQSEIPAGEVDISKEQVGKPGDPSTFLTEIEPAGDDTGDAAPGQAGGDIPEDPAEATNAQNEQLRQERLAKENRPEGAEVNNSNRDYDPETARFAASPEPEEELGPFPE